MNNSDSDNSISPEIKMFDSFNTSVININDMEDIDDIDDIDGIDCIDGNINDMNNISDINEMDDINIKLHDICEQNHRDDDDINMILHSNDHNERPRKIIRLGYDCDDDTDDINELIMRFNLIHMNNNNNNNSSNNLLNNNLLNSNLFDNNLFNSNLLNNTTHITERNLITNTLTIKGIPNEIVVKHYGNFNKCNSSNLMFNPIIMLGNNNIDDIQKQSSLNDNFIYTLTIPYDYINNNNNDNIIIDTKIIIEYHDIDNLYIVNTINGTKYSLSKDETFKYMHNQHGIMQYRANMELMKFKFEYGTNSST